MVLKTRVEGKGQSLQAQTYGICDNFLQTPPTLQLLLRKEWLTPITTGNRRRG